MILDVMVVQRSLLYRTKRTRDHHRVGVLALPVQDCFLEETQVTVVLRWKGLLEARSRGRDSSDSKALLVVP